MSDQSIRRIILPLNSPLLFQNRNGYQVTYGDYEQNIRWVSGTLKSPSQPLISLPFPRTSDGDSDHSRVTSESESRSMGAHGGLGWPKSVIAVHRKTLLLRMPDQSQGFSLYLQEHGVSMSIPSICDKHGTIPDLSTMKKCSKLALGSLRSQNYTTSFAWLSKKHCISWKGSTIDFDCY